MFNDWRGDLERELRSGELHPSLEGHLSKYRSLVPSLALICSLADGEDNAISAVSTQRAIAWGGYLRGHAERIWSTALAPDVAAAIALSKRIIKGDLGDEFALRDVQRRQLAGLTDRRDIEAALAMLCELDWLKIETRKTATKPATVYLTNPKLKARRHASDYETALAELKRRTAGRDERGRGTTCAEMSVLSVPAVRNTEKNPSAASVSSLRRRRRVLSINSRIKSAASDP